MSKDEGGRNSSFSEKPVRSRLRRLVDWINLTGAKKVHSLIDKVYKRKNLEMAWEKVKANRFRRHRETLIYLVSSKRSRQR